MNKSESKFNVNALPISKKAYLRLVARIDKAFEFYHKESVPNAVMIAALNRYLIGDVEVIEQLPPALFIAFQFVMQDADMAMERSRKARERARLRREARQARAAEAADAIAPAESSDSDETVGTDETVDFNEAVEAIVEAVASTDTNITEAPRQSHPSRPKHPSRHHEYKRYTPTPKERQKIRKVKIRHLMSHKRRPHVTAPRQPGYNNLA